MNFIAEYSLLQELRNIYYHPGMGYRSIEKLCQKAKELKLDVGRREVRDWLRTQDTHARYKPIVRKHKFKKHL